MSYHKCERCGSESSVFWHTLGYGCSDVGDGAIKVFEFCDTCLIDLVHFMQGKGIRYCPKKKEVGE